MKHTALAFVAAGTFALAANASNASTIDFTIDVGASSVSMTNTTCIVGNCVATASLSSSLGGTYTIAEGATETFDFLEFDTAGGRGFGTYDIVATLAFTDPVDATTTITGTNNAYTVIAGSLVGGVLTWDDSPVTITLSDGSIVTVGFDDASNALQPGYSTTATIGVVSTVPVPFAGAALAGGLGLLPIVARRRRRKAA
ncbi:hypothetical protein [Actibacterium lipolyticum]|uniref:VPLPA-CTERM protein sorting domain-containing protein n=1 Tax=Actibacterium lipolyticum TaxID=1524263 RepID=A0A238JMW5_9RHOB|nr:hypothetical protein [Actibacterium lipolyticum]SMX31537.1 hypothetical protein COL8621_00499 [Actibacterium lipolyticum]